MSVRLSVWCGNVRVWTDVMLGCVLHPAGLSCSVT